MFSLLGVLIENNLLSQTVSLILSLLVIVGQFRVFQKAGQPGWYACIPFKDMKTESEIAGKEDLFKWEVITLLAENFFCAVLVFYGEDHLLILMFSIAMIVVMYIVHLIVRWKVYCGVCGQFGKSKQFAVCITLFPYVFMMILGFDDSKFAGAKKSEMEVLS